MQGNIEQSGMRTRLNVFARRTASSRAARVRHLATLAILFVGSAVLQPSPIHGQSPLTPIELVLPLIFVVANDWGTEPVTVAYDDWSDDVFNPRVEALAQEGGAVGEALIGRTEWAKASAGPNSHAETTYLFEIDVEDPQNRPGVKTISGFQGSGLERTRRRRECVDGVGCQQ